MLDQEAPELAAPKARNNTSISECPDSYAKWYCLNGATCFLVKIRDSTLYNCWCPRGFHGLRCDYKYVTRTKSEQELPESWRESERHIGISIGAIRDETQDWNPNMQQNVRAQSTKGISQTVTYNLLILFLLITLIVLILRYAQRKTAKRVTMEEIMFVKGTARIAKNGQINHDSILRLDLIKRQHEQQHLHHENITQSQSQTLTQIDRLQEQANQIDKYRSPAAQETCLNISR